MGETLSLRRVKEVLRDGIDRHQFARPSGWQPMLNFNIGSRPIRTTRAGPQLSSASNFRLHLLLTSIQRG